MAQARLSCSIARQSVSRSRTQAAVRAPGTAGARMSCVGEELAEVLRELAGPVDLGGARRDPLVGEDADGVAEEQLLLGQAVRPGRGRGGHAASYGGMLAAAVGRADRWPDLRPWLGAPSAMRRGQALDGRAYPRIMDRSAAPGAASWPPASASSRRCCILRRQRRRRPTRPRETPFAVSTEGMKRCPSCGIGNLVDRRRPARSCGKRARPADDSARAVRRPAAGAPPGRRRSAPRGSR